MGTWVRTLSPTSDAPMTPMDLHSASMKRLSNAMAAACEGAARALRALPLHPALPPAFGYPRCALVQLP
jgi:hypothetical protein